MLAVFSISVYSGLEAIPPAKPIISAHRQNHPRAAAHRTALRLQHLAPSPRGTCSTDCPRRGGRAMALPRAAIGQPFSPCPALSACRASAPAIGSGLRFEFSPEALHTLFCALARATSCACALSSRIEATARRGARTENPKVRNRRLQKKFNGTATKPRLSVFCSSRQLYAVLADDHNKKILFYGSTLQKSICGDPPCSTVEAARKVGEELVRVCEELGISEISSYDRNGFARGEKMMAFEVPVSQHGFLPR
ncbi:hypothetical protein HU200_003153 [Digitaria exilis]|uniref:Ribosomal protein L18 n=1 Tax=Digitaria exilis TaxID=1010633 RepID=A0A835FWI8_9POAL|nr:hypothetical protein HU200_003153 [Digitaria exilis]